MSLPTNLTEQIRKVGATQKVDIDETIRSVTALMDADECISYRVWGGPGFGQENVLIDIYVLGRHALYSYTVMTTHTQGTCNFLDAITGIGLVRVPDERSPYLLLAFEQGQKEASRVFGNSQDLQSLEHFRTEIISQRLRNRRNGDASLSN